MVEQPLHVRALVRQIHRVEVAGKAKQFFLVGANRTAYLTSEHGFFRLSRSKRCRKMLANPRNVQRYPRAPVKKTTNGAKSWSGSAARPDFHDKESRRGSSGLDVQTRGSAPPLRVRGHRCRQGARARVR